MKLPSLRLSKSGSITPTLSPTGHRRNDEGPEPTLVGRMTVVTANRKDRPEDVVPTQLETDQAEGDHMSISNIQACSYTTQSSNCIVTVAGAYRAPLSDEEEVGKLCDYLARVSNHAERLVIMRDFNSPEKTSGLDDSATPGAARQSTH
ncbi:unnamed protein product [Echinostoma caproni]|uniref:Uncharacterized protein n=1 Tax=Echinostoma caproni TaxID=27848 RepID=A0A183BBL9_9TREM|nr:unnamed protein product [Echinostoma caproni]